MTTQDSNSTSERQIVVFALGNEEFGVNINEVREIIRMEQITKIPNTLEYIKGVINLRGGIIVVVDLAMKLGIQTKESDKNTRILVVEVNETVVGMIVDSATEVLRLNSSEIQPAPSIITQKINSDYLEGVGTLQERLLILLDLAKVLEGKDMEHVKQARENASNVSQLSKSAPKSEAGMSAINADTKSVSDAAASVSSSPSEQTSTQQ